MAESKDKWDAAVKRLIERTKEGEIEWYQPPHRFQPAHDELVGAPYIATLGNKVVAIYEYRYKQYSPDLDEWYWANGVAVMFYDIDSGPEWQWPHTPACWELLEAVRYHVSGAEEFLGDLLNEP